jgi:hypothetical protein
VIPCSRAPLCLFDHERVANAFASAGMSLYSTIALHAASF